MSKGGKSKGPGKAPDPKGTRGDDVLNGNDRDNRIDGGKGDDQIFGNGGNDWLRGGKGDDLLDGGTGNDRLQGDKGDDFLYGGDGDDILYGNQGRDILLGGAGNDTLYGDDKSHGFGGWHSKFWFFGSPTGYDDYLDGGAGSDKVYGGKGNDIANYTWAENLGSRDFYDGGRGFDTLQLSLTYGEFALDSVQQDIARYESFLDSHANPHKHNGRDFHFESFNLKASNFEALNVRLVNTGPLAGDDAGATDEDTPLTVSAANGLFANDSDPDHLDVLSLVSFDAASAFGATVMVGADGSYSYDPTSIPGFQALQVGESVFDSFTYTIRDLAGETSTATVTIEVAGVNDAPVANDDGPFVMRPTQTLTLDAADLLANDTDADGDALYLSGFQGSSSQGGTISAINAGQLLYTPAAGFTGTDMFMISVADGFGGFDDSVVTIDVVNSAPVANDDGPFSMRPGQTLTLDATVLFANDTDADGDTLYLSGFQGNSSQGGTISAINAGQLLYTPAAGFTGTDMFLISVADGFGGFDDSVVTINVINSAPVAGDDGPFVMRPTQTLTLDAAVLLANDTDADGDALYLGGFQGNSSQGGTITAVNAGQLLYTPAAGFTGTDTFLISVSDGFGGFDDSVVTIDVVNSAPVANDDGPFSVAGGQSLTLDAAALLANDTDADNDTLYLGGFQGSSSQGGTITAVNAGQLLYTPAAGFAGTDTFLISVDDGFGGSDTATVSVVVTGDPPPPPPPQGSNAVLPSVSPAAADALSYYIHFEGISGQSWLELGSFSFSLENSASFGSGGAGAGKATASDIFSAMGSGPTTTALLNAIGSGKLLSDVEIEVYRSGDTKDQLLAEYKFSNVVLTGLDSHGGEGLASFVSFDYSGFGQRFIGFDSKTGQQTGETTTSWDLVQNSAGGSDLLPQGGAQATARLAETQVGDSVQLEYFVRFDGISGWLELEGYSFGIDNNSSTVTGGGGGAGISTATGVALSLGGSAALTSLTGSLLAGKQLANVEIEVYRTGLETKDALIEEFRFTDVTLSSLSSANASGNLLTFEYDQITHAHRTVDSKGAATTTTAGWDFVANEPEPVPGAVADAVNVQPLPSVPSGADLDYYIHFEGVSGSQWLQLDSFSFGMLTSGTHSGGGGGGAGKVQVTGVHSALGSSATTTALLGTIGAGKILNDVEIEVYRPGDSKDQLLAEYKFSGVVLTGLNNSGNEEQIGTDVSFDYLGFGQRQISFDSKTGQPTGEAVASWDFINNTAGSGGLLPQSGAQATAQLAESQAAGPNLEYYVRFDGFTGWLELDSFSLDVTSSLSLGGGGAQIGKATAGEVALSLGASTLLTSLTGSLLAGKQLANVEIEVYRTGLETKDALIEEFRFTDVTLSSLQSQNASGNLLAFDYGQITHAHRVVDSKGLATTTNAGWDFIANEAEPVPGATADALAVVPVVSTPVGADLDYYIRFEGISGSQWLELGAFSFDLEHSGGGLIGSGGGAGKVSASDVFSALGSSATATRLLEAFGSGQMLDGVDIEVYRSGLDSKDQLLAEYRFSDVVLTTLTSFGAGTTIGNNLSFDFSGFGQRQLGFDNKTGQQTGETTASWDFSTNTAGGGALLPQAGGQAVPNMQEPQIFDASQLDYYVRFDGVNGWLQLETFQFSGFNSTDLQSGGGAGAGISTAQDAVLTLGASAALTGLTGSLFAGKHLENIEIEVYRSSGETKAILIDEFHFEDVVISGLHSANAVNNLLTFDFEKVSHAHRGMDSKGSPGDFTSSGWDFAQNMEFSGPNPTPDVDII